MKRASSWCLVLTTFFLTCCSTTPNTAATSTTIEEISIDAHEATIYCKIIGDGTPILVLHGGPGLTHDYLFPQMASLAKTHRVIFYDQRGCGRSTGEITSDSIQLNTYLNDIEAIRKALGYKKMTILGHSWGGFLAMNYAIAHPEAIDKLVLLNSTPLSSDDVSQFGNEVIRRLAPYEAELNSILTTQGFINGDPDVTEKYWQTVFKAYCYNPEKVSLLNLRLSPEASANVFKVFELFNQSIYAKPFNFYDQLQNLKIDTLIMHGDADPISPAFAQKIHDSIPHSQYILLKNCGHFPYVETPDTFFQYLNAFLDSDSLITFP
jgi:proline iminopeptidase